MAIRSNHEQAETKAESNLTALLALGLPSQEQVIDLFTLDPKREAKGCGISPSLLLLLLASCIFQMQKSNIACGCPTEMIRRPPQIFADCARLGAHRLFQPLLGFCRAFAGQAPM